MNNNPILINEGVLGSIGRVFRDDFRGLSQIPAAAFRFIKPIGGFVRDPKTKKIIGVRANTFRRKALRDAFNNFSFYLPRMIISGTIGAAQQYMFTTKEKLLIDLINAYKQASALGETELSAKIKKEIIKTEQTPESTLKAKAALKGSVYGTLIGAAWGFASTLKYATIGRRMRMGDQAHGAKIVKQTMPDGTVKRVLRFDRDKPNQYRKQHHAAMRELGKIIRGGKETISARELTDRMAKVKAAVGMMQSSN